MIYMLCLRFVWRKKRFILYVFQHFYNKILFNTQIQFFHCIQFTSILNLDGVKKFIIIKKSF